MVRAGLIKELKEYFNTTSIQKTPKHTGLDKAIGVPELREYFGVQESF